MDTDYAVVVWSDQAFPEEEECVRRSDETWMMIRRCTSWRKASLTWRTRGQPAEAVRQVEAEVFSKLVGLQEDGGPDPLVAGHNLDK